MILDRPHVIVKEIMYGEITKFIVKTSREYNEENLRRLKTNSKLRSYWSVG